MNLAVVVAIAVSVLLSRRRRRRKAKSAEPAPPENLQTDVQELSTLAGEEQLRPLEDWKVRNSTSFEDWELVGRECASSSSLIIDGGNDSLQSTPEEGSSLEENGVVSVEPRFGKHDIPGDPETDRGTHQEEGQLSTEREILRAVPAEADERACLEDGLPFTTRGNSDRDVASLPSLGDEEQKTVGDAMTEQEAQFLDELSEGLPNQSLVEELDEHIPDASPEPATPPEPVRPSNTDEEALPPELLSKVLRLKQSPPILQISSVVMASPMQHTPAGLAALLVDADPASPDSKLGVRLMRRMSAEALGM